MSRASSARAPRSRPSGVPAVLLPARNRGDDPGASERQRRLVPTIARWPLDLDAQVRAGGGAADTALAVVRSCLADYRSGRADQASRLWHDDIVWSVPGPAPIGGDWTGASGVFAYHALLERLSEGTFRQRLVALEGCRGATVSAYLRTTIRRGTRRLEIPTLALFELAGGRVRRVTELPGDRDAWAAFWAD